MKKGGFRHTEEVRFPTSEKGRFPTYEERRFPITRHLQKGGFRHPNRCGSRHARLAPGPEHGHLLQAVSDICRKAVSDIRAGAVPDLRLDLDMGIYYRRFPTSAERRFPTPEQVRFPTCAWTCALAFTAGGFRHPEKGFYKHRIFCNKNRKMMFIFHM
jgi:hypothetical protein